MAAGGASRPELRSATPRPGLRPGDRGSRPPHPPRSLGATSGGAHDGAAAPPQQPALCRHLDEAPGQPARHQVAVKPAASARPARRPRLGQPQHADQHHLDEDPAEIDPKDASPSRSSRSGRAAPAPAAIAAGRCRQRYQRRQPGHRQRILVEPQPQRQRSSTGQSSARGSRPRSPAGPTRGPSGIPGRIAAARDERVVQPVFRHPGRQQAEPRSPASGTTGTAARGSRPSRAQQRKGQIACPFDRERPGRVVPGWCGSSPRHSPAPIAAGIRVSPKRSGSRNRGAGAIARPTSRASASSASACSGQILAKRRRRKRRPGDAPRRPRPVAEPEREAREQEEAIDAQIAMPDQRTQPGKISRSPAAAGPGGTGSPNRSGRSAAGSAPACRCARTRRLASPRDPSPDTTLIWPVAGRPCGQPVA